MLFLTAPLLYLLIGLIKRYASENEKLRIDLLEKWENARDDRITWCEDHGSQYNFDHPEYQELWDIEIGADALYIMSEIYLVNRPDEISWPEYQAEKLCFERSENPD